VFPDIESLPLKLGMPLDTLRQLIVIGQWFTQSLQKIRRMGKGHEPERGRGRISFTFHSLEALEGILKRLGYRP